MKKEIISFTAASTFPVKLFLHEEIVSFGRTKRLLPIHIVLNPTNRCNQSCPFCSCGQRDKNREIPFDELLGIIERMHRLGTKAATITGGGEPTLYKGLDEAIGFIHSKNIKVGLTTNGIEIDCIEGVLGKLTWCRFSLSDAQKLSDGYLKGIAALKKRTPRVDYGFSYVVTRHFNPDNLRTLIDFVAANDFPYIRVVPDLIELDAVPDISSFLGKCPHADERVVYQKRTEFTRGRNPCYLSLLKPNIGPDGNLYPCCSVQFSTEKPSLDFTPSMSMGRDVEDIYSHQRYFNGQVCMRCYYDDYNQMIQILLEGIKHAEFV